MKRTKISLCFLTVAILLALTGCATVEPWERGRLAKPHMALDPSPMQSSMRVHTFGAREAASSGGTAEGGGCGCY
jgi:Domain of unknown function (DUF4266)